MKQVSVFFALCILVAFAFEDDKRLVYGNDDRTEPYSITDANLLNLVQADVALIPSYYFTHNGDGTWTLSSYGTYTQGDCTPTSTLCSDEPFKGQMEAAFCSGFFVESNSSNIIVTAGHCLDGYSVTDFYVVFGWKEQSAGVGPSTTIPENNFYIPQSLDYVLTSTEDWGVISLNRDVVGRTPLKYRTSGTPSVGTSLVLVGHPWGLPMKVAPNAQIKSYPSGSTVFSANTDSYAGNSGSMVVNTNTWEVEGILINGNADYAYDSANGCCRSNVCSDTTGCSDNSYEGVTKITVAHISTGSSTTTGNSDSGAVAVHPALILATGALAVVNAF